MNFRELNFENITLYLAIPENFEFCDKLGIVATSCIILSY